MCHNVRHSVRHNMYPYDNVRHNMHTAHSSLLRACITLCAPHEYTHLTRTEYYYIMRMFTSIWHMWYARAFT